MTSKILGQPLEEKKVPEKTEEDLDINSLDEYAPQLDKQNLSSEQKVAKLKSAEDKFGLTWQSDENRKYWLKKWGFK